MYPHSVEMQVITSINFFCGLKFNELLVGERDYDRIPE